MTHMHNSPHRNEIEGVTDAETRAQKNTKAANAAPQLWTEITDEGDVQ